MKPTQFLELAVSLSLQVAVVVGATWCLTRLIRSEVARGRLWTGCYAVLLGLLLAGLALPHLRILHAWRDLTKDDAAILVPLEIQVSKLLFAVWLIGAALSGGKLLWQSLQVRRFIASCRPVSRESLATLLDAPGKAEVAGPITFLASPALASPFCWQIHRPYVVLPEFVLSLAPDQLRFVLRHELEHLRTGHPLQLFLQNGAEILFWFHPLVWWASRQAALTREFACDDAALRSAKDVAGYLTTLLLIVEHSSGGALSQKTSPPLAFGYRSSITCARARRLVQIANSVHWDSRRENWSPGATAALMMAGLAASFLWLPVDMFGSPRGAWSPWPRWTAGMLHEMGVPARDFEVYDCRFELKDLDDRRSPSQVEQRQQ